MSGSEENPFSSPETAEDCGQTPRTSDRLPTLTRRLLAAATGSAVGFAVWASSRYFTGHDEPWDSDDPFYVPVLCFGGFLAGLWGWRTVVAG